MKKSELKTGMYVQTRAGLMYMVMKGVSYPEPTSDPCDVLVSKDGWMKLSSFFEDMTLNDGDGVLGDKLDIVAVYSPLGAASLWRKDIANIRSWKCIWKREEPSVEMTIAEIEKKLGIKNLKIIKEHEDE